MPSCARALLLAALILAAGAVPARADLTVFAGLQNAPAVRPSTGIGLGFGLLLVGWEVEIARVTQETENLAPSIASGTASVYVQNPIPISGVQVYAIAGAGLYRERLADVYEQNDVHVALGGGAKIQLIGPLKLRLDYRFFKLRDSRSENPQRVYAGLTLSF
jgi:opacity protein-like surface antigen